MNYPGSVALCMCSLVVVALAFVLPLMAASQNKPDEPRALPLWIWSVGAAFFVLSAVALRQSDPTGTNGVVAMLVAAAQLGGVSLKWLLDLFVRKPTRLRGATLAKTLLLAPWVPLIFHRTFAAATTPGMLLLWFANGFFWQTLVGDCERMFEEETVIVRRREPAEPASPGVLPSL